MRLTTLILIVCRLVTSVGAFGFEAPSEGGFAEVPSTPDTSLTAFLGQPAVGETSYLGAMMGLLGRVYDGWLSPQDGPRCRFTPTCSAYGRMALGKYGPFGGWLRAWGRLLRCNRSIPHGLYPIVLFDYEDVLAAWDLPAYPECGVWAPLNLELYLRELRGHLWDPLP